MRVRGRTYKRVVILHPGVLLSEHLISGEVRMAVDPSLVARASASRAGLWAEDPIFSRGTMLTAQGRSRAPAAARGLRQRRASRFARRWVCSSVLGLVGALVTAGGAT